MFGIACHAVSIRAGDSSHWISTFKRVIAEAILRLPLAIDICGFAIRAKKESSQQDFQPASAGYGGDR